MLTTEAFEEHESNGDEVGGEETSNDEGDDGIEGDGRPDVDEPEEGVDSACKSYGVEGYREGIVDLFAC